MFRRKDTKPTPAAPPVPAERVTSVLGGGTIWKGSLSGSGGVRIEGAFEGEIALRGLLVIGATGRVTCPHLRASAVIVAGALRGDVTAERVEIRSTGRVWGNVITAAFSTEEGAFLRGQIQMEDKVDIGVRAADAAAAEAAVAEKAGVEKAGVEKADTEKPAAELTAEPEAQIATPEARGAEMQAPTSEPVSETAIPDTAEAPLEASTEAGNDQLEKPARQRSKRRAPASSAETESPPPEE